MQKLISWGKNSIKKEKTSVLLENNQPALQCLVKRKTPTELPKLIRKSAQYTK